MTQTRIIESQIQYGFKKGRHINLPEIPNDNINFFHQKQKTITLLNMEKNNNSF